MRDCRLESGGLGPGALAGEGGELGHCCSGASMLAFVAGQTGDFSAAVQHAAGTNCAHAIYTFQMASAKRAGLDVDMRAKREEYDAQTAGQTPGNDRIAGRWAGRGSGYKRLCGRGVQQAAAG